MMFSTASSSKLACVCVCQEDTERCLHFADPKQTCERSNLAHEFALHALDLTSASSGGIFSFPSPLGFLTRRGRILFPAWADSVQPPTQWKSLKRFAVTHNGFLDFRSPGGAFGLPLTSTVASPLSRYACQHVSSMAMNARCAVA